MTSVYHIVTIRVNETSWAHVWRLHFRYLGTGYDTGLASKPVATIFSSLTSKLVAAVSSGLTSKPVMGFLVEPQNQGGGVFPGLGIKTGSFGLVIWGSKSPRLFLGLGLKTKWASVYQLHHKTDGARPARDTRQDLAACFAWSKSG
jgi:hypothetical protein